MNFREKVLELAKKIPKGRVSTYAEIAGKLNTKAYRAIGNALRCNPDAPMIPCHRVVSSSGHIGGYKGIMNNKEKANLLKKEGIEITKNKIDLSKYLFRF